MQAQRYQRGSLGILKRKSQPDAWAFRYYAEEGGRRVYKRRIIGTVLEFPKRRDAERQLMQLRVDINEGAESAPINVEQLATHFKNVEAPQKSYSTREGYKKMLNNQVIPRWGNYSLAAIRSIEVENWLRKLSRKDGKPASPATKSKIRNVMSAIFSHAIRYGWASHNPITAVRTSAKRLREPDILTPQDLKISSLRIPGVPFVSLDGTQKDSRSKEFDGVLTLGFFRRLFISHADHFAILEPR